MADDIAKLIIVLFGEDASIDLPHRLYNDSSLKPGWEKLYVILKQGVQPIGDGKLGLQGWDQSQMQAVASVAYAIALSTRSLCGMCIFIDPYRHVLFFFFMYVESSSEVFVGFFGLIVEHMEPIIVAVVQQSLEFALCCLEKSVNCNDDWSVQVCTYMSKVSIFKHFKAIQTELWLVHMAVHLSIPQCLLRNVIISFNLKLDWPTLLVRISAAAFFF